MSASGLSPDDELLNQAHFAFERMLAAKSTRPTPILDKWLKPYITLFRLDAEIREAKRCAAYKTLGSPRVVELEAQRNRLAFEIAKLEEEKRGRRE